MCAQLLVEAVNYNLYNAAMGSAMMAKARASRVVRTTIEIFDTQPFLINGDVILGLGLGSTAILAALIAWRRIALW